MIRVMIVLAMVTMASAAQAQSCRAPSNASAIQSDVAQMMNAERRKRGLRALTFSPRLQRAAQRHVCDMAANGVQSHRGSDGSNFARRLRAAGGCGPGGENIAWGQRSAASVMAGWMGSSGHRANILHRRATSYGIAVAQPGPRVGGGPRWVMVVGGC